MATVIPTAAGSAITLAPHATLPGPLNSTLTGVACPSSTSCFAVGQYATATTLVAKSLVEHWNGTNWSVEPSPNPTASTGAQLFAIACPSTTNCWAVGHYTTDSTDNSVIEHWNGSTWTLVNHPTPNLAYRASLNGISCPSPTNCYAVGTYTFAGPMVTLIEHWNGAAWSVVTSPNGPTLFGSRLSAVSCPTTTSCFAVGAYEGNLFDQTLIEQMTGTTWSVAASPSPSTDAVLVGVACPSPTECWAVGSGDDTLIEGWDGSAWSIVPGTSSGLLSGVACPATTDCFAVGGFVSGTQGRTLVEQWNGTGWSAVPSANENGATAQSELNTVACANTGNCEAGGSYSAAGSDGFSTTMAEGWNGSKWTLGALASPPPPPPPPPRSGYWMLGRDGHVYAFGDAPALGSAPGPAVAIAPRRDGSGYWTVDAAGNVSHFGTAADHGSHPALDPGEVVSTISATTSGNGYWLFTSRGRAFAYGDAGRYGDMTGVALNGPIIASVATGHGYYMIGSDGGVFSFGDARFHGSTGNIHLNRPVVGISPTPDDRGYWLVASDGGVFAFDASFRGSMGAAQLNKPVNGLVAYGNGYLMVASDGGIFDFSDKPFVGSLGNNPPSAPIIGIAAFGT